MPERTRASLGAVSFGERFAELRRRAHFHVAILAAFSCASSAKEHFAVQNFILHIQTQTHTATSYILHRKSASQPPQPHRWSAQKATTRARVSNAKVVRFLHLVMLMRQQTLGVVALVLQELSAHRHPPTVVNEPARILVLAETYRPPTKSTQLAATLTGAEGNTMSVQKSSCGCSWVLAEAVIKRTIHRADFDRFFNQVEALASCTLNCSFSSEEPDANKQPRTSVYQKEPA